MRRIYLDHAATTPLHPAVRAAMSPFLGRRFGNPSSIHGWGREAKAALDDARDSVAAALHADYAEIIFTSGATEADNLAIVGGALAAPPSRDTVILSSIEHPAVLHTQRVLERLGRRVILLPVGPDGLVAEDALRASVNDRTALVSIMHANNEIGVIQDIPRLAALTRKAGALFHTDAAQSFAWLPLHARAMGVDMVSLSAHKLQGPKGVGALWVREGVPIEPLHVGGGQERERRPGTENVAGIVGFGAAVRLLLERREEAASRVRSLASRLMETLRREVPGSVLYGSACRRLPNILCLGFPGTDGAALVMRMDRAGVAISSGAACSSGSIEPSHVVMALGVGREAAACAIRISLGYETDAEEVDSAAKRLVREVRALREIG